MSQVLSSSGVPSVSKRLPGVNVFLGSFNQRIRDIDYSPNGKHIAVGGDDSQVTVLTFSDDGENYSRRFLKRDSSLEIVRLCFSPDSDLLACSNGKDVWIWKLSSGDDVPIFNAAAHSPDTWPFFHPSGKELVIHDVVDGASIWDIATCKRIHELSGAEDTIPLGYSAHGKKFLSFSLSSRQLVAHEPTGNRTEFQIRWDRMTTGVLGLSELSADGTTWIYTDENPSRMFTTRKVDDFKTEPWWLAARGRITQIGISPDAKYVAAAFSDGFSPDGKVLVTALPKSTVCVWRHDQRSGEPIATMTTYGVTLVVSKLLFCRDSTRLLVSDRTNPFIWDFGAFPEFHPRTLQEKKIEKLEAKLEEMTKKVDEQAKQLAQKGRINRKPPQAPGDDLADVLDTTASRRSTRVHKPVDRLRY